MSETTTESEATTESGTSVDTDTMKWVSGFVSLVGLWIAVSAFVYPSTATALWNNLLVGGAVFLLAGFNYYRMTKEMLGSVGVASLVALLGLWAVISPFIIAMGTTALAWSTLLSGIVVAAISGYNAYENRKATTTAAGAGA